jgi:hypothetical protein
VAGSGFAAFTTVNLALYTTSGSTTTSVSLGTVVTDATGAFTDHQVTLPAGIGAKTLAAIGLLSATATTLRYQTAALQVQAAAV